MPRTAISRLTAAAFLLNVLAPSSLLAQSRSARAAAVYTVPQFAPAPIPGMISAPALASPLAAGLTPALAAPAPLPAPAARAATTPAPLHAMARLGSSERLAVAKDGTVTLESAKEDGDRLFDMRADQLEAQWPAVQAALEAAAASVPEGGRAMVHAVRAELKRLTAAGRAEAAPGAAHRGPVRLDAEIAAPLKGVSALLALARTQAEHPRLMAAMFGRLLDGYGRAIAELAGLPLPAPKAGPVVNDVTRLNPVAVDRVEEPETIEDIAALVGAHKGPVSVGGGRFSMGGQTATEGALQIDMRRFNKVLNFDPVARDITVQAGIRWRDIQEFADPHGLAVKIMQTYANFTVGGALSVNAHGRYMGLGPVILSVKEIKVVMADGRIVTASPEENAAVFYGAIGGYGALGVIAEVKLSLTPNTRIEREVVTMPAADYPGFFMKHVRPSASAVFHNADFHGAGDTAVATTWYETDKPLTVKDRLKPIKGSYWLERWMIHLITERPWGDLYRRILNWIDARRRPVTWRNYEASYDVAELEPASREKTTYVLQEYFVPVERFASFGVKMREILHRHGVTALNVSIRHARKDPGSLMAWARQETFAYVLYHKQGTSAADREAVAVWTRELIDAAISEGGAYYLPYQIHATPKQFHAAYPRAKEFFALKKRLDPTNKFRNKLLDAYYEPASPATASAAPQTERFKTVYGDARSRDAFFRFLQNVYHLYPEASFHRLIAEETAKGGSDEQIYRNIQARLNEIKPFLAPIRYALPSLAKQKEEMADQTRRLIDPSVKTIRGYVEVGTPGRYVKPLRQRFDIKGPVYLVHEKEPGFGPEDIFERGGLRKQGKYLSITEPIDSSKIPDESVDLVTVYIGLHHFPPKALDRFVKSMRRVLRPGGRLVIRDHDAKGPEMKAFVELAHDVYNAGLGMPWAENAKEYRKLTETGELTAYLAERGFQGGGKAVLQDNDPTLNTLLEFVKVEIPGEAPGAAKHHRKPEMTYLTVPEWYIVYSAREYADILERSRPSAFPYIAASIQYWQEYRRAANQTRARYGKNKGAELMLWVIGVSFTAENIGKAVYENTVGRLFELLAFGARTADDAYGAKIAREYANFVNVTPWYEFPYASRLKKLWTQPLLGRGLLRSLERRLFLTAEYAIKAGYAVLIKKGAQSAYEPESMSTLIRVDGISAEALAREPRLKLVGPAEGGGQYLLAPRYGPFTEVARFLSGEGVAIREIAGNSGDVVLTALVPKDWNGPEGAGTLLDYYGLLTAPDTLRVMKRMPVAALASALAALERSGATIEHVYDY